LHRGGAEAQRKEVVIKEYSDPPELAVSASTGNPEKLKKKGRRKYQWRFKT
jgi:hypothetical protein